MSSSFLSFFLSVFFFFLLLPKERQAGRGGGLVIAREGAQRLRSLPFFLLEFRVLISPLVFSLFHHL